MVNSEFLSRVRKPNYLNEEIIKTIDMIAGARDEQLGFDKTIIAKILSISNADIGEYWVEYQQGRFKAYASTINSSVVYKGGTSVYVKIPNGDFSNKKIIEGIATAGLALQEFFDYDQSDLLEIHTIYENYDTIYSVLAGAPHGAQYYEQVIYENDTDKNNDSFRNLFMSYPHLKISAEFKTDFKSGNKLGGNYGLLLEFYTLNSSNEVDPNKTYIIKLDRYNFSGSNIEYAIFSEQYAVYPITTATLTNLKKITFFQENFNYDIDDNGKVNNNIPNIFVKNIKLTFNEVNDDSGSLYKVYIKTVDNIGNTLLSDSSVLTLQGMFFCASNDMMDSENCTCYWFKQNPEIFLGHEKYNEYAGPGWEMITNPEKVDFNLLKLKGTDVYQQLQIKLVVVYNGKTMPSAKIPIIKSSNSRFAIISKTETDGGTYLELLDGRNTTDTPTVADWYVLLDDGTYEQCNEELTNKINITHYLNHLSAYFQAYIEIEEGVKVPYDYTYTNKSKENSVNVVFAGTDTFLYDTAGNITYSEANKEILITPTITKSDNTVIQDITWKGPKDIPLYEAANSPEDSMLQNIWCDTNNVVHFTVRQNYQISRNQNTLTLIIKTIDNNIFSFNKVINFVKQGEQGSGGLAYTMVIEQCDSNGNETIYSPLIYDLTNSWKNIYLRPQIYINGDMIKDGDVAYKDGETQGVYHIKFEVQKIGVDVAYKEDKDYYEVSGVGSPEDNKYGQYFVRFVASIYINDKLNNTISYYHPVMVGVGGLSANDLTITNLPNSIMYSASGADPIYNKEPIKIDYSGTSQTELSVPISLTPQNINITSTKVGYYIRPVDTYTGANFPDSSDETYIPMGAIKLSLSGFMRPTYIIQPIAMILSTQLNQKLEGYDGTAVLVIDENNLENTKEVNVAAGSGTVASSSGINGTTKDVVTDGALLGREKNGVSGLYEYDTDGNPSNVIKSNGNFSMGNGALSYQQDETGAWSLLFKKGFELRCEIDPLTGNEKIRYVFSDGFIEQLKTALNIGEKT